MFTNAGSRSGRKREGKIFLNSITISSAATAYDFSGIQHGFPEYELQFINVFQTTGTTVALQLYINGAFQTTGYLPFANGISITGSTLTLPGANSAITTSIRFSYPQIMPDRAISSNSQPFFYGASAFYNSVGQIVTQPVGGGWSTAGGGSVLGWQMSGGTVTSGEIRTYGLSY